VGPARDAPVGYPDSRQAALYDFQATTIHDNDDSGAMQQIIEDRWEP